ncbi:MAG: heavy-metal-associated domain-containing protein [Bacteroidetes bacterium]|nr:heavy-metal-associated domain-containing protein [Bacteroidota bacterium]
MKNIKFILPALLALFVAASCSSQKTAATTAVEKTETFKVLGNCGMCQKTIQGAALKAGAKTAAWDMDAHTLTVSFDSGKTSVEKIQEAVAKSGYDTPKHKATEAAYNNLPGCCQFDRSESLEQ